MMQMHVRGSKPKPTAAIPRPNHLRRCESTISMIATLKIMIEGRTDLYYDNIFLELLLIVCIDL